MRIPSELRGRWSLRSSTTSGVVDWQSNEEVKRLMRRDIKRELRPSGDYTEDQLEELANWIVELAQRRSGR